MKQRARGTRWPITATLWFKFQSRVLGRKLWWQVNMTNGEFHVLPYDDDMMHDAVACICGPIVELREGWHGDEWFHIHRPLDGRPQTA